MKWIKYQFVCNKDDNILLTKRISYSEENLAIAAKEAYNGQYVIEEDAKEELKFDKPWSASIWELFKNQDIQTQLSSDLKV